MQQYVQIGSLLLMLGLFYLIVFIPENKRKKKFNAMIKSLKINDEVITRGGLMGKVVGMQDDFLILQTGPDRVKIKITKSAISNITTIKSEEVTTK